MITRLTARFATLSANMRGAFFMSAAMFAFAIEDFFIKRAALQLSPGQITLSVGVIGVLAFGLWARAAGEAVLPRAFFSKTLLIRSGFEVSGRLFYSVAIAFAPMTLTVAILQASPLVVVAGAALLFGEKIGWRRWLAVGCGFLGVLLVIRPTLEGVSMLSLFAVLGMLGFAGRDLATRAAPKVLSNNQLGVVGFAMLALAGAILLVWQGGAVLPTLSATLSVATVAVFAIAGYRGLTRAMRMGDVGAITPFRYTRLVFAMLLALVFLGERPDLATLVGAGVIILSGLYTLRAPSPAPAR